MVAGGGGATSTAAGSDHPQASPRPAPSLPVMAAWMTKSAAIKKYGVALAAFLVAIGAIVYSGSGDTPIPPPTTTTTTTVVGPVTPSKCEIKPTSPPRSWETPAAQIATSPDSAKWADRIWKYAGKDGLNVGIESGIDDKAGNDYSVPLYCASDATTTIKVYRRPNFGGSFQLPRGTSIPWNPAWRPSDGRDGFLVIVDPSNGREWDLWAVSSPQFHPESYLPQTTCALDLNNAAAGFSASTSLCAASLMLVAGPDGQPADVRTYRGNFPPASGGGVQNTFGLTTPAEVASGKISHVLEWAVGRQSSMTGPVCPDLTSPYDPRIGLTCGVAVAPAGQFESRALSAATAPCTVVVSQSACLAGMIPDGTRWVLTITDAEIEAWLDSEGYVGQQRATARTFVVALRDYGAVEKDTTGLSDYFQVAGAANPTTATQWRALAVIHDLISSVVKYVGPTRIRVLVPPTNLCPSVPGGTSQLACHATDSVYGR